MDQPMFYPVLSSRELAYVVTALEYLHKTFSHPTDDANELRVREEAKALAVKLRLLEPKKEASDGNQVPSHQGAA